MLRTQEYRTIQSPLHHPAKPIPHRAITDGNLSVQTNLFGSLDAMATPHSPFFASQLHGNPPFIPSPHSVMSDTPFGSPPPGSGFSAYPFLHTGGEHREPPVHFSSPMQEGRRPNNTRPNDDKAKAEHRRKLSFNDQMAAHQHQRGRSMQMPPPAGIPIHPPRAMSFSQGDHPPLQGLGFGLATHQEGQRTEMPTWTPDGFAVPVPRRQSLNGPLESFTSIGSVPGLISGSIGSLTDVNENAILDSPYTPAGQLPSLPGGDSAVEAKKQKRRASHNAVEKRRREHINVQIDELNAIVPAEFKGQVEDEEPIEMGNSPSKKKRTKSHSAAIDRQQKDAKGSVLSGSVKYITFLQQQQVQQAARIQALEAALADSGRNPVLPQYPSNLSSSQGYTSQFVHPAHDMHNLQTMRPSPEVEDFDGTAPHSWNDYAISGGSGSQAAEAQADGMVLETSPTNMSGESAGYPRSQSLSGSVSERGTASERRSSSSMPSPFGDFEANGMKGGMGNAAHVTLTSGMGVHGMEVETFEIKTEDGGMRW